MKKLVILNLSLTFFALTLFGCQAPAQGPSDEQLVGATMAEWKAAMVAKDLDKLMAKFSEDYISSRGSGKVALRERMSRAIQRGFMDNVEVNDSNAKIKIVGGNATFGPVEFVSDSDTFKLDYILRKENAAWLIVGSKRYEQ